MHRKKTNRFIPMVGAVAVALLIIAIVGLASYRDLQQSPTYLYCVGDSGHGHENLTFYAPLTKGGIGQWHNSTSYPVGVDDVGCDIYNGYIYCTGTNDTTSENQSYYANVSPSGIGSWIKTTSYPFPTSYQSCSAYNGYIYCIGDWQFLHQNATEFAPISRAGIGKWMATTPYPQPFYWGSCSINNGYIYCVGGGGLKHYSFEPDNQVVQDITQNSTYTFFAPVSSAGIGNWTMSTPYPVPFIMDGCPIYNNRIYCIGDGLYQNLVYYANVSASGIGNWIRTTNTPIPFEQSGCDIHNGYVYCVGSRANGTAGNQTWYTRISANGSIGGWSPTTEFPLPYYGDSYCEIPGSGGGWTSGGGPQNPA